LEISQSDLIPLSIEELEEFIFVFTEVAEAKEFFKLYAGGLVADRDLFDSVYLLLAVIQWQLLQHYLRKCLQCNCGLLPVVVDVLVLDEDIL